MGTRIVTAYPPKRCPLPPGLKLVIVSSIVEHQTRLLDVELNEDVKAAAAMHFGAMECFRRAILPDQPPDVASKLRKDGANLARGMAEMLEVLEGKRGKGPQVVRVERVIVHEGGQAVVGNVQTGRIPADVDTARRPTALAQEPPSKDLSALRDPEKVPLPIPQGRVPNHILGSEPHG